MRNLILFSALILALPVGGASAATTLSDGQLDSVVAGCMGMAIPGGGGNGCGSDTIDPITRDFMSLHVQFPQAPTAPAQMWHIPADFSTPVLISCAIGAGCTATPYLH